ncbi:hypothetical protein LCGC14_1647410 [marine sediment metagenome]|uniref:Uncharacterized protein n=1 Tax=marine sediment metagenome TaxID=412755 RepID=A0A0F9KXU4_9ZZZZ
MFKINPCPEWYEKAIESERDYDFCIGPSHNVAWHIHLLYILILKDKLTIVDILRPDSIVTTLIDHRAQAISGEWEGSGLYARVTKNEALKLIKDFMVL